MDIDDIPIYSSVEKHVCPCCVSEALLKVVVERYLDDDSCSYCGESGSAPVDVILDEVCEVIGADFTDPANELPYESREGGYQGVVEDGSELVWEIVSNWIDNDVLMEDVAQAFAGTAWCRRHYFRMDEYDVLSYGWNDFVEQVKHRTRYLFLQEMGKPEEFDSETIPPGRMLDALGRLMQEFELYSTVPTGFVFFRARVHDPGNDFSTPDDLGPPPRELAGMSNRMSPAGIPMFYGALDERTAFLETFDPRKRRNQVFTIASFSTARPMTLLDLTSLPETPSPFDAESRHLRRPIRFLREFVADLAKPIQRDGFEHVEYVPTQVVTEFIRHRLTAHNDRKIDGILYSSSRAGGKTAAVLFFEREHCGPRDRKPYEPEIALKLNGSVRKHPEEFGT